MIDMALEGEIIPPHILQDIFPQKEFSGKKILIHRDGNLPDSEKEALMEWGNQIGTTFYFVEVIKSGTPRLYASQEGKIVKAPKGSIFKLGENEALLVSSEFPAGFKATPQPVRVCTHPPFPLKHALHSVLSLTLLHYGSIRLPRLPVTIHYLERLGSFIFGGVMMFGMFWMRHHYLWWKLHPIGSLMMTSYATYCFWGSFFIGWFLKYTTLKFGGVAQYRKLRPLILGVVLGACFIGGIWIIVGFMTGIGYRLLPG